MAEMDRVMISIMIVTYNNATTIGHCLDSLAKQTFTDFEILIRDNASSDGTAKLLADDIRVRLFVGENNIGFGRGMNFLAERASGEYLFILNPDCECPADLLAKLIESSGRHEGALAPALVYPDGTPQPSARELPDYRSILYSRRSPLYQLGLVKAADAGYLMPASDTQVPAVAATALMLKKSIYDQVGGFDDRYFLYGEDLDLCQKLGEIKLPIWYLPALKIKHILGASSTKSSLAAAYYHHLSIYKYFTKHFPRNYIKNFGLMILLTGGFLFAAVMKLIGRTRRK
jgi:GT2 family glycosyltransferase